MSKTTARQLVAQMNKVLGPGVVTTGSDARFRVEYMPTDLLPIDVLLQGGIPRGRFVLLKGPYSTLKSYIGLHAIAATQRRGGQCVLFDTEHAFDPEWAESLGVDLDALILQQPETGEVAVDTARTLTMNAVDLIVFDSIAATLPAAEATKRASKDSMQPGRQAALMSLACRLLTAANTGRTGFIWINQLRENIGVTFGPTEKGPGGRAMPFYASLIVDIRKSGKHTREVTTFDGSEHVKGREEYAQRFRATVEKSKLNRPFRETLFDFRLEEPVGLDVVKFIFAQAVELGLITKRGNTWHLTGSKTARSREGALEALAGDHVMQANLEHSIREVQGLPQREDSSSRRGRKTLPSAKASGSSAARSKSGAAGRTPARATAASSGTVLRRKTSSK